jgi:hypothetical protein
LQISHEGCLTAIGVADAEQGPASGL